MNEFSKKCSFFNKLSPKASSFWFFLVICRTIARPLDGKLSRSRALLFITLIWMYVIPWAVMPVLGLWGRFAPEGFLTTCTFDYLTDTDDTRNFVATIFTFSYVIPMTLIIYYYSQIVSHVVNHEKSLREQAKKMNVESLRSNANSHAQSAEIRIAKVQMSIKYWENFKEMWNICKLKKKKSDFFSTAW